MNQKFKCLENKELLDFLRETLTNKSKNNLKSLLAKEMVLVNGSITREYNHKLSKGDIIEIRETKIRTNNNYNKEIKVLYEDEDIIVINKPCGLLSIATSKEKEYTLYHFISTHLKERNKNNKVFIIHRLDKDTSGIVIFAKNQKTKNLFQNNWDKIIRGRYYYAVVNGTLKKKEGTIKEYLIENDKTYMVYSTNNQKEGKLAITDYKVVKENKNYSLLDINIKTGRKKQIRVALKDIGNPIVGDKKYGDGKSSINRMALHQYKLELMDPRTNKFIRFKTDMPITFKKLI
jgi:RluA family pseudouridine synthase